MKLIFGLIVLIGYWPTTKIPKRVNSLFLQNVEALAGSEHVTNLGCLGDGSVDYFQKQYPDLEIHYDVVMSNDFLNSLDNYALRVERPGHRHHLH